MSGLDEHWLNRYGNGYYAWKPANHGGKRGFERPIGLVETSFDTDGRCFGGRADLTALFSVRVKHRLDKEAFRRRIALAWANLRLRHVMLMSRTLFDAESRQRRFVVDLLESIEEVLDDVLRSIVWVEDYYEKVDEIEMHRHAFNVGRIVDPGKCLSKVHVLPLVERPDGSSELRFLVVMAHQISDGLSAYNWFSDFVRILNLSERELESEIDTGRQEKEIQKKLPPAQEDLYPQVARNKARERWFWAIIRVLRHLHKPTLQSFTNPLRREERPQEATTFPLHFSKIFDYSDAVKPPLNSGNITASLSSSASKRMIHLCRSIHVSIGAGCFALAGLAMMAVHEARYPHIPNADRLPFASGFPLNPRAFFGWNTPADSCMLAFSEGIVMPFLPSSLPVEGRFKLIACHANRELRMYQKRVKGRGKGERGAFEAHSPARLLANAYLNAIERSDLRLPEDMKWGVTPHGDLPPPASPFRATCGVSSTLRPTTHWLAAGTYDLGVVGGGAGQKDFAADFLDLKQGVRAREEEFLVGSSTDAEGRVRFGVSYDESAISEEMAGRWRDVVEGLLEADDGRERARI
ncbi:hypothetical protein P171DRAFT_416911 [Karstenula rhodostoma CBS 690.94]|uniref:Uncharacterized protein n=1 Tax=Karstenula rhodostoma CBS 690.94 TaxID=1392251 RepID=A0A9P4PDK5_9PLEO|nr:hypothetical protein P171DRAFT_416911 [Karstenula rhodostoma CBS 690.94]